MQIWAIFRFSKKKIIILLILFVVAFFIYNNFTQSKQTNLQFAEVKKQNIKSTVSASGFLTGKALVNLKFKSAGKLSYINVKIGDTVTKGQTIAGLDTQDLSIALQQAQNTYRDKQAIAEKIEDDVKDHSKDESFAMKVTRTTAQAARDSAYDAVKEAQRAFQDVIIFTPIDGIVTQAISLPGQTVNSTDIIAKIVDTSEIYFNTEVDEADLGSLNLKLPALITLDSYPDQTFEGIVEQIYPITQKTSSGATVVEVRLKLSKPPSNFVDGLTGEAQIITDQQNDVLSIPIEGLRDDGKVVILSGGEYKEVEVNTGIQSESDVQIKAGLNEGDKVLLNPPVDIKQLKKAS